MRIVSAVIVLLASSSLLAQETPAPPKPGPYVNVYHDEAVIFQVHRERLADLGNGVYNVRLRWLWATPRPWKSSAETATLIISNVDCPQLRVRELAIMHKDTEGKIFDVEEFSDEPPWKTFPPNSGAAAAMTKLCEFLPELIRIRPAPPPK